MNKKPNVLWIFSDEHRAAAMSCLGDENIETTNMDKLAKEGVLFSRAYSNAPLCSPFRASLLTAKYPSEHGVTSLHVPLINQKLISELMREYGYHTSYYGKWHLSGGEAPSHFVSKYFCKGFDEFIGWENSNRFFETKYFDIKSGLSPQLFETLQGFQTDALTDIAIESIDKEERDIPWFKIISYEAPHPPSVGKADMDIYQKEFAPKEYLDQFCEEDIVLRKNVTGTEEDKAFARKNLRAYYASIKNLDDNIGRVIESLKNSGQYEDTIIFYFSDHGDFMGSHGVYSKTEAQEESTNIPMIVSWPNHILENEITDKLFSGVDIAPTMLGVLGLPIPSEMSGMDLSHILQGKAGKDRESVLIQLDRNFFHETGCDIRYRALVTDQYKYIYKQKDKKETLYDLKNDPYEEENICSNTEIKNEMNQNLKHVLISVKDEFLSDMN